MSQISRVSQIGNFLDSYCKTHAYFLPSWVPSQIRNIYPYHPLPSHNAVPVQWLKMQSVMKAVDDALIMGGRNSMPPRVWTCLRHAPAILFFVPRGNLSKYKIVKPATVLRDHWPKVSLAIQAFATLTLLAAGRRLQAAGMLIGISVHAVLMMDVVPDKVKSVITIVDQFVHGLYFYGPNLLKSKKDPLELLSFAYFVYSTVRSLYELLPEEPPVPLPHPKVEPVARYDQIRFSDLIVNPDFDPTKSWGETFSKIKIDNNTVSINRTTLALVTTSDRHYLELAAFFLTIQEMADTNFRNSQSLSSAKDLCKVWEKDVYKALETLEKADPEQHVLYTTAAWLISYRMQDLSQIATGYLNEQLKGSVEEQLKACWKVPSENLAYALLTKVPRFSISQPKLDPNQPTSEKAIQQMEIISKVRQQQKALELIKMGILQQKQPVKPTT